MKRVPLRRKIGLEGAPGGNFENDSQAVQTSDFRLQTSHFEGAALQAWMDPLGHRRPRLRIALNEGLDLFARQLEALVPQVRERVAGALDEAGPQFFVRQKAADHQLNRLLRHVWLPGQGLGQPRCSGQRVKCT